MDTTLTHSEANREPVSDRGTLSLLGICGIPSPTHVLQGVFRGSDGLGHRLYFGAHTQPESMELVEEIFAEGLPHQSSPPPRAVSISGYSLWGLPDGEGSSELDSYVVFVEEIDILR